MRLKVAMYMPQALPVLLSLALVLGPEVSSGTNFESLALKVKSLALRVKSLALSKSPWPRQVGQPVNLIFQGTSEPQKP